jgi:hypothetical protein
MRLWSLHPRYLDPQGLVAVWREALLAQKIMQGATTGYTHHPQLTRFRSQANPGAAIAAYLSDVYAEAARRGYHFDQSKIGQSASAPAIPVTLGQLTYEQDHLLAKLRRRSPDWAARLEHLAIPEPHPLFFVVPGGIASWEIVRPSG